MQPSYATNGPTGRAWTSSKEPDGIRRLRTVLIAASAALFALLPVGCAPPAAQTLHCPYYRVVDRCLSPWEYVTWLDFANKLADNDAARAGDREAIKRVIHREFGTAGTWAVGIAERESHLTTGVISSAGCVGIFQLSPVHRARAARLGYSWDQVRWDNVANISVAADLYRDVGPGPWRL